jgi:hypothetical protein
MSQAMKALGGYITDTDSADDLTYRVFYMLRFCGFSAQAIAVRVKHTADNGLDDPITPTQFINGFGTIPDMAPLRHVASTSLKVGPAEPTVMRPFMSHQVAAANLSGRKVKGYTLEEVQQTNGAPWIGIRVLDKRGTAGVVTGTIASGDEDDIFFAVTMSDMVNDPCTVSAEDVYKWHLTYQAQDSTQDFSAPAGSALANALAATQHIRDARFISEQRVTRR